MGKRRRRDANNVKSRLSNVEKVVLSIEDSLKRSHFYEYVQYASDEKRILRRSFLVGLMKGLGSAVGVTILGAIVIYFLHALAMSNLPYIADFISDIINIIESRK